ncbi:MAG: 5-oxoprolinase (ATP-hydrolyzing) [Paracoccaceae bacterium]|jgi:5-oxoprolinase (ATP-hydrolysing)
MVEWQIRIDVGGTFTDGWAISPKGKQLRCKVLSSGKLRTSILSIEDGWLVLDRPLSLHSIGLEGFFIGEAVITESIPNQGRIKVVGKFHPGEVVELTTGEDAPIIAARILTGTAPGEKFPPLELRVATTRGTNALLEGTGTPVDLYTTAGFESLLEVRDQRRPDLFELAPKIAVPVTRKVIGIRGRLDRHGNELEPLDESVLDQVTPGPAVAIAMVNSDCSPAHEKRVADILRARGFGEMSVSHECAPVIRLWPRMETAVANAYLTPVMGSFISGLSDSLPGIPLALMTSAGQLKTADDFQPIDSLLSGPAGGIAGAAALAKAAGLEEVLTFDMGGTSTDVARISGEPGYRYEQEIGPVKVLAPAVKIETVAAGGGSICQWRNGGLEVGPESAGSHPGPACYGCGGPLTVTDVNLLLGYMDEARADIPLDRRAAEVRLEELLERIGGEVDRLELLNGLRRIAIEHMAEALRQVSTREGYDCRDHALIAFGGAGPQHACALARELGMARILIPADAGLLSAWGLHQAGDRELRVRQILATLDESVGDVITEMSGGRAIHRGLFELRLKGQDSSLEIETGAETSENELREAFEKRYRHLYRDALPANREIECVALRVELVGSSPELTKEIFEKEGLVEEGRIEQDGFSTLLLEKGWRVYRGSSGSTRLDWEGESMNAATAAAPAVVEAELFRRRFEGVVEEMGELLRRTALSTNIKERLDYSCALLDSQGRLVVNAPHIPVHLGALGLCVRIVSAGHDWKEGDTMVVNHPGFGGSHLPDVTVISPVFVEGSLLAFVANRAHHAEIGGMTPGSMPPAARCLAEEGIVIPPTRYEEMGEDFFKESRSPADNQADLKAQVTANRHGVEAVVALIAQSSARTVEGHMDSLYRRTAALIKEALVGFESCEASDQLDDGSLICVKISKQQKLVVDFTGSADVHPGNLNATPAIVRSAVLYALRLWIDIDLPLNEGLLENVEIITEEGILNPPLTRDPQTCPAVVGGNVETSQRIVDVLLEALGLQSNGQGTMNNFLFGNAGFGFYETMGGGAGAGPGWNGRSGCHVHMSNTAITDVEILEERYPVRVREFGIRRESGGKGIWNGGDGLIREIEFLETTTVSLLTQRRTQGPGPNGKPGRNQLWRDGEWRELGGIESLEVEPGDRIRIETPGGGAWLQDESREV